MKPRPTPEEIERGFWYLKGTLRGVLNNLESVGYEVPPNFHGVDWVKCAREMLIDWEKVAEEINEFDKLPTFAGDGI